MRLILGLYYLGNFFIYAFGQRQGVGCLPKCTCGQIAGKTGPRFSVLTCDEIPKERLPSNISNFKVLNSPPVITSKVFSTLSPTQVKQVDLCESGIKEISGNAFSSFIEMTVIKLSLNQINIVSSTAFVGLPFLKEIYLDGNKLQSIDQNCFSSIPKLHKLYLQHNQLTMVPNLPKNLQVLDFSQNHINQMSNFTIQENIKYLDLCDNNIVNVPPVCFTTAKRLQSLCVPGEITFETSEVQNLQNITLKAPIVGSRLSEKTTERLKMLSNLQHLTLIGYTISSIEFLIGKTLRSLRLIATKLENTEEIPSNFLILAKIQVLKSLEYLDLTESSQLANILLTHQSLKDRIWEDMPRLKSLILRNCSLQSLGHFKTDNEHQVEVDISYNPLNCDCSLKNKFIEYNLDGKRETETLCSEPAEYRGQVLPEVMPQMLCKEEEPTKEHPIPPTNDNISQPEDDFDPTPSDNISWNSSDVEDDSERVEDFGKLREDSDGFNSVTSSEIPSYEDVTEHESSLSTTEVPITNETLNGFNEEYHGNYDTMESEADEKTQRVKYIVIGVVVAVVIIALIVLVTLYLYLRRRGKLSMPESNIAREATSKDNLIQFSKK